MVKKSFLIKTILTIVAALIRVLTLAQPAVDGYMKGKSNLDLAPGITYESFSKYYWKSNDLTTLGRTSTAFSLYGAMGLTNWLDAQVSIPYIYTAGDFSNLQDFSAYLKASLFDLGCQNGSNFRLMLAGGYAFPMTNYKTEGLNAIGQRAEALEGRMIAQYSWSKGFFMMAQAGYASRNAPVPSGALAAFKIGLAKSKYYVDLWYDQKMTDEGNDYFDYVEEKNLNGSTDMSFRTFGVSYGKVGGTYYRPLNDNSGLGLSASYVLWGRNVGQAFGVSVSYVKRISFVKQ